MNSHIFLENTSTDTSVEGSCLSFGFSAAFTIGFEKAEPVNVMLVGEWVKKFTVGVAREEDWSRGAWVRNGDRGSGHRESCGVYNKGLQEHHVAFARELIEDVQVLQTVFRVHFRHLGAGVRAFDVDDVYDLQLVDFPH